jgi:hypothetical protein
VGAATLTITSLALTTLLPPFLITLTYYLSRSLSFFFSLTDITITLTVNITLHKNNLKNCTSKMLGGVITQTTILIILRHLTITSLYHSPYQDARGRHHSYYHSYYVKNFYSYSCYHSPFLQNFIIKLLGKRHHSYCHYHSHLLLSLSLLFAAPSKTMLSALLFGCSLVIQIV